MQMSLTYNALLLLSLFWGCAVISNILHCTAAGAVADWWFSDSSDLQPKAAVAGAFRRAISTSFGSVCFGSLLVALLSTLRSMLNQIIKTKIPLVVSFFSCLLELVERCIKYFNKYAFCYVAIYGTDFMTAGKEVSQLFLDRGWTAVINDELTSWALKSGCLVGTAFCAILGMLLGSFFALTKSECMLIVFFGAVVGYWSCLLLSTLVESAVATVFVCFAEDPQALVESHPRHYMELMQIWVKIHGSLSVYNFKERVHF